MSISTNAVGNYNVFMARDVQKSAAARQPIKADTVSNEEKAFFADMYPERKQEIADYHFYQRSGKMSGVSVGSLLDRRM